MCFLLRQSSPLRGCGTRMKHISAPLQGLLRQWKPIFPRVSEHQLERSPRFAGEAGRTVRAENGFHCPRYYEYTRPNLCVSEKSVAQLVGSIFPRLVSRHCFHFNQYYRNRDFCPVHDDVFDAA